MSEPDDRIAQFEQWLAVVEYRDDPTSDRLREHAQPLVDERHGRVVLTEVERAAHLHEMQLVAIELGAAVSNTLDKVGEVIHEGPHKPRRRQSGGDDIEGSA